MTNTHTHILEAKGASGFKKMFEGKAKNLSPRNPVCVDLREQEATSS